MTACLLQVLTNTELPQAATARGSDTFVTTAYKGLLCYLQWRRRPQTSDARQFIPPNFIDASDFSPDSSLDSDDTDDAGDMQSGTHAKPAEGSVLGKGSADERLPGKGSPDKCLPGKGSADERLHGSGTAPRLPGSEDGSASRAIDEGVIELTDGSTN